MLDTRCWILDTGFSNFEIQFSDFKVDFYLVLVPCTLFGSCFLVLVRRTPSEDLSKVYQNRTTLVSKMDELILTPPISPL